MTAKNRKRFALDVIINPSAFLFERGQLDEIQKILRQFAPQWTKQARRWLSRANQEAVDLEESGAIEFQIRKDEERLSNSRISAILGEQMKAQGVPKAKPRFLGGVEMRSNDDSLTVIVRADEYLLAPSAGRWLFGNEIALQIRRSKIESKDSIAWAEEIFEAICAAISPLHGVVHTWDEYDSKNMSHEGGGLEAVGVDASKHLSGIYWLNFFGKPYLDLIGSEVLLTAPAVKACKLDEGVMIKLDDDPRHWTSAKYKETEKRVLQHIGEKYFFSKEEPKKITKAPAFEYYGS